MKKKKKKNPPKTSKIQAHTAKAKKLNPTLNPHRFAGLPCLREKEHTHKITRHHHHHSTTRISEGHGRPWPWPWPCCKSRCHSSHARNYHSALPLSMLSLPLPLDDFSIKLGRDSPASFCPRKRFFGIAGNDSPGLSTFSSSSSMFNDFRPFFLTNDNGFGSRSLTFPSMSMASSVRVVAVLTTSLAIGKAFVIAFCK